MSTTTTAAEPTKYTHDVFISYSRANKEWVRHDLVSRLREAHLRVLIDEDDFEPGANLLDSIEQAVEKSRHTLAVLTPYWLDGEWTTHERHLIQLADPSGRSRRLIPLMLEKCALPKSMAQLIYLDFTDVTTRQAKFAKLLGQLGRSQEVINNNATVSVQKGLRALIDLMQTPEVYAAVGDFEDAREDAVRQIKTLSRYKGLHDHFHNAESAFGLVAERKKSLRDDAESWGELQLAALALEAQINPLLTYARAHFPEDEVIWAARLARAQQGLLKAIEDEDTKKLNDNTEKLIQVIGQVPTQLNSQMYKSADGLPLAKLAAKLRIVGEGLKNLALEGEAAARLEEFKLGLDDLEKLDRSLRAFVANHNCLQEIDNQLKLSKPSSQLSPVEIQDVWEDLKVPMKALSSDSGADWIAQFRMVSDELGQALAKIDPAVEDLPGAKKIRSLFFRYRSLVTQGFKQVDQDLKTFCEQLQKVGDTLGRGLQRMQHA